MNAWRTSALVLGAVVALVGLLLLRFSAGPMLLIFGLLIAVTAALEPRYGRADSPPKGPQWQQTDERFVDPENGKLVSVWFETKTGERRYVTNGEGEADT